MCKRTKSKLRTRPFTLLEICLSLAILALISGFLGVKIKESIDRQQFLSNVSEVACELKQMQGLALSYRSDFGMKIFEEKGQFFYKLVTDEPLDFIKRDKPFPLKGVTSISLNRKHAKEISLQILPTGKIEPEGVVGLQHDEEERFFDFRSLLHIKAVQEYPKGK